MTMLEAILNIDTKWFLALNGSWGAGWDTFFYWMSDNLIWIPLYLLILGAIWYRWGWKTMLAAGIFIALSVILADQICNIAKYGLKKLRPTHNPELQHLVHTVRGYIGGPYSTFSAHAATTACIAIFTSRVFKKTWYTFFIWAWVVVVCYSRIYLGVHFPLDLLLGGTTGFLMGWWAFNLFKSGKLNRFYTYP